MKTSATPRFPSRTALRWEAARAQSRQCILDAAGVVFAQEGFERATMKRIAEVCGLSKVTLYAHFRDKEDLYTSVMDGHLASMPSCELDLHAVTDPGDALLRITEAIERTAADSSCQAFCKALSRSGWSRDVYLNRWGVLLEPYLDVAERVFAQASVRSTNARDSEMFLTLILLERGLPLGAWPVADSAATVALFLRSYGVGRTSPALGSGVGTSSILRTSGPPVSWKRT